jgi:hypothetical protein
MVRNAHIEWTIKDSVSAKRRIMVKTVLGKDSYPSDMDQTVPVGRTC